MLTSLLLWTTLGVGHADPVLEIPLPRLPIPRSQPSPKPAPPPAPPASVRVEARGIVAVLKAREAGLVVDLEAATTGWLMIGFSTENTLVGSDLHFVRVEDGRGIYEDHFVRAHGEHYPDEPLGGGQDGELVSADESAGRTRARLRLPWTDA